MCSGTTLQQVYGSISRVPETTPNWFCQTASLTAQCCRVPNSSAVVGHLIRAKPKFTVTCHHYHPTMPSRIPSKSRKKGQWIKDVKGTTQGIPGIQWYPGAAVAELQASTSLFAFSSSSCIQPAIKGGKTPLATTSKTSKIPRDIKEIQSVWISIPTSPIVSVLEVGFLHLSKLKAKVVRRHGFSRPFRIPWLGPWLS